MEALIRAFRSILNVLKKLLQSYWTKFSTDWLTAWLTAWDSCNSTMDSNTGLIFSLFDITSAREVFWGAPLFMQCILHGLTSALLSVPFIFFHHKSINFVVCTWWLPLVMKIICDFHSGHFGCRGSFLTVVDLYYCITG